MITKKDVLKLYKRMAKSIDNKIKHQVPVDTNKEVIEKPVEKEVPEIVTKEVEKSILYRYNIPNVIEKAELYYKLANTPRRVLNKSDFISMKICAAAILDGISSGKYKVVPTGDNWTDPDVAGYELLQNI